MKLLLCVIIIVLTKTMCVSTREFGMKNSQFESNEKNGVYLPIYSVCLIAITMSLMLIVIAYLSLALYKSSKHEYKVFKREDPVDSTFETFDRSFIRQHSKEIPPVCTATSTAYVDEPNGFTINKPTDRLRDVCRIEVSTPTESMPISPRIKKNIPTNVISQERMDEICRQVLSKRQLGKSDSSKELNELLKDVESFERRPNTSFNRIREKSSSTPELLDLYDSLPPPRESNGKPDGKEAKGSKEETNNELTIPLYDCPPVSSNHINGLDDSDTQYLFPIIGATTEPSYINANRNDFSR